jgi:hypothetical protein
MLALLFLVPVVAAHDSDPYYYSRTDVASMFVLMILVLACIAGVWASAGAPQCDQSRVIKYVIEPPKQRHYHPSDEC